MGRYLDIDTILTRSWQYQDFLILLLILILSKSWEEYWYWLSRGNQYQDFLILILILNRSLEKYWYWLGRMNQYQDILILILILYKALDEYWYCLVNHNQYQGILILFIGLESQSCQSQRWEDILILTRSWQDLDNIKIFRYCYWYWSCLRVENNIDID